MGCSWFLRLLLLSMLLNLILSVSQGDTLFPLMFFLPSFSSALFFFPCCEFSGMGRNMVENVGLEESSAQLESRGMIEIMDYKEPGPNTNPRAAFIFCPPPQP
ncbi:hypothetical protein GQ457_06G033640 [Hibiscus cannabinus]